LNVEETAEVLHVSVDTVKRDGEWQNLVLREMEDGRGEAFAHVVPLADCRKTT